MGQVIWMDDATPLSTKEARALIDNAVPEWAWEQKLIVGCSGGPDSLALTLLAADAFPGRVHALIVDHGLRPESAADVAQTKAWLVPRHVPADILVWEGEKPTSGLQAAARTARYRLMTEACKRLGGRLLLLAHHLDDQAETFLMALGRKAGLQGLAGMTPCHGTADITYIRPFLEVSKARLVKTLDSIGQDYICDPSNENERFDRARLRQQMAALATVGIGPDLLAGAATRLADPRELIQDIQQSVLERVKPQKDGLMVNTTALMPMLGSSSGRHIVVVPMIRDMIRQISGAEPRFEDLDRIAEWIAFGDLGARTLGRCRLELTLGELFVCPEQVSATGRLSRA